jgi:cytosine/adenosine deaminase-related metal-dependent hydrolase
VRVNLAYGVTDRHGSAEARRGLAENERYLRSGGRGMVGVHAAFTCRDETLVAAAELATDLGVGVHIHVAEGVADRDAGARLERLAGDDWLLVHCVHLDRPLRGTIAHNPRSNMNNAVGYAAPTTRPNRVVLGTDGIGADMLEEARLAYVRLREHDVSASPDTVWSWLDEGYRFFPECRDDRVEFNYDHADSAWHTAFTPGVRAVDVTLGTGQVVVRDGRPTRVDVDEVRAKAAEQAVRLFARL